MRNAAAIAAKKERRARLEAELGAKQRALPDRRYGVILADPAWRFEPYSRVTGMDRAADNHYPTSPLDEIKRLDVPSIAAKDSALFLWSTVPMLPQALEVMAAWGFAYKSCFTWLKDRAGTGYWSRNKHEILLVGTRGRIPAPAPGTQWPSAIEAPVGRHSEKPAAFYKLIESYFPTLPKIELHARGVAARPGWEVWGLEPPLQGDGDAVVVREGLSGKMSSDDAHDDAQARNEAMLHALAWEMTRIRILLGDPTVSQIDRIIAGRISTFSQ
jgi:N6-adenosine-specific RNA methylase IME4